MAATSLSSSTPRVAAKPCTCAQLGAPRSSSYTQLAFLSRRAFQKLPPEILLLSSPARNKHARTIRPATDNSQAAPTAAQETAAAPGTNAAEGKAVTPGNGQPQQPAGANANGSATSEAPKRAPLTARERLRAARVLGKYAEPAKKGAASSKPGVGAASSSSRPPKPEFGSGVLDALREADAKKAGGGGRGCPRRRGTCSTTASAGCPRTGGRSSCRSGWTCSSSSSPSRSSPPSCSAPRTSSGSSAPSTSTSTRLQQE